MVKSVKILSPHNKVSMPILETDYLLDVICQKEEYKAFIAKYPDPIFVVYVNTLAGIKVVFNFTVTSFNASEICEHLNLQGEKILWVPDKYLGCCIEKKTSSDMGYYNGACVVHEEFKSLILLELQTQYLEAAVLLPP